MNTYVKQFLHRGLLFGGFGPIVVSIIYAILQNSITDFSLSGTEVCLAVVSSYILAFVQAGVSVFNQIDSWSIPKSLLCHLATLYITYIACYLINTWIPLRTDIILIFTGIFLSCYFIIWISVYFSVKAVSQKLNRKVS